MYNCGCGGGSISISIEVYITASLSKLREMCEENDYTKNSSSPWYDSVLESGEYKKREKYFSEENESDVDEEIIQFETED